MARTARPVDLELVLAGGSSPLRHRIADALVAAVAAGRIQPGDPLPASRALAATLGVARSAVVAAYDELQAAGFVESSPGAGTFVARGSDRAARLGASSHVVDRSGAADPTCAGDPGSAPDPGPASEPGLATDSGLVLVPDDRLPAPRWDCRPGRPDAALIDPTVWRRAWTRAARSIPGDLAGPAGHRPLRMALADHLRRTRGVLADPDQILILPSVAAGLRAVVAGLGLEAGATIALEDPGYRRATTAAQDLGLHLRAVPTDDDGLITARLAGSDAAVYLTPAHQYPLGGRLSVERRGELLGWAERGGVIIEDDYDGEFRYGVAPLPALRALTGGAERVVYLGTATKLLTAGLRIAWAVPPDHLRTPIIAAIERLSLRVDGTAATMLAGFISSGAMATHLARVGREYAHRSAALRAAFEAELPHRRLSGVDAGLHVLLPLPEDTDDVALAADLARAGLLLEPLSRSCLASSRRGLVIGFAQLPASAAPAVARLIADRLAAVSTARGATT